VSRYLTVQQAADELGLSTKTIYRMVKDGELAAIKVRGRVRIERSALPSPTGPRRMPPPRPSKYGAPGTLKAEANRIKAGMA
jgi:excisionase family DNA binding protein